MEEVKTIGSLVATAISLITLIGLIVKPLRQKLLAFLRKSSNIDDINKLCEEVRNSLQYRIDIEKQNSEMIKILKDAQLSLIRNSITRIYFRYFDEKCFSIYEKENLSHLHDAYASLKGNTYVDSIFVEMMETWTVKK